MKRKTKPRPAPTLASVAALVEQLQADVAGLPTRECNCDAAKDAAEWADVRVRRLTERLDWFIERVRADFVPVVVKAMAQLDRIEAAQGTALMAIRATKGRCCAGSTVASTHRATTAPANEPGDT